jgi:hypothetical protein
VILLRLWHDSNRALSKRARQLSFREVFPQPVRPGVISHGICGTIETVPFQNVGQARVPLERLFVLVNRGGLSLWIAGVLVLLSGSAQGQVAANPAA